jgi:NAD(P)-dependent dehydrogenase (short-subunit alcohol dehydrogenase family)
MHVVLITGVSPNGLGIHTAKALAVHHPALLIVATRSQTALDAAISDIEKSVPGCPTRLVKLDLGSIRTVRAAAEEVNSWQDVPKIDILINNAAAAGAPWTMSEDGIEQHFATNHIGPFLFTNLVMEKVIAARGRVVNVASVGHLYSGIRFEDVNFKVGRNHSRGYYPRALMDDANAIGRMAMSTTPTSHMASRRRQTSLWLSPSPRN